MGRLPAVTASSKEVFLTALSETGVVSAAAAAAGVSYTTACDWRRADPAFAEAAATAIEISTQKLEQEAIRRAAEGTLDAVYYQGEVVGHRRRYSDQLLMFLLRGRRPDVYRTDAQPLSAADGPLRIVIERPDSAPAPRIVEHRPAALTEPATDTE